MIFMFKNYCFFNTTRTQPIFFKYPLVFDKYHILIIQSEYFTNNKTKPFKTEVIVYDIIIKSSSWGFFAQKIRKIQLKLKKITSFHWLKKHGLNLFRFKQCSVFRWIHLRYIILFDLFAMGMNYIKYVCNKPKPVPYLYFPGAMYTRWLRVEFKGFHSFLYWLKGRYHFLYPHPFLIWKR